MLRVLAVAALAGAAVGQAPAPWAIRPAYLARVSRQIVDPGALPGSSPVVDLGGDQELLCYEEAPGVRTCRGIPYAAPPVGELRWQRPQPAARWSGVLNATADPPGCMQLCEQPPHTCPPVMSEDCLYMNVFSPTGAGPGANLPVMFWIYGGNFKMGYAGGLVYDGTAFVQNTTGMVVVTIKCVHGPRERLGAC